MADTQDLKSCSCIRSEGSTPSRGTVILRGEKFILSLSKEPPPATLENVSDSMLVTKKKYIFLCPPTCAA